MLRKPKITKGELFGAIILPLLYLIPFLFTHNLNSILRLLGPFSIILWVIQWVLFLIGGQIFSLIGTVFFLSFVGFLLGRLVDFIISRLKSKKN